MSTLQSRLTAIGVQAELPERPHMALCTQVNAETIKWADEHSRRTVYARELESLRQYALSLERALESCCAKIEAMQKSSVCAYCDGTKQVYSVGENYAEFQSCPKCDPDGRLA